MTIYLEGNGYLMCTAPEGFSGTRYGRHKQYAYAHLVSMWWAGDSLPQKGENAHHINENKQDNRPINLIRMTKRAHSFMHRDPARHGTISMYSNQRCSCSLCKKAWTEYAMQQYYKKVNTSL